VSRAPRDIAASDAGAAEVPPHAPDASDHDAMLMQLQRESFGYFLHEVDEETGLVLDKTAPDWPASIAAVGMALTAYPVGVRRGLMPRAQALARTLATLRFLASCPQGDDPDASGHRGFFYHFLDMKTGRRAWRCELSTIDTALLIAGVLVAAAYFDGPDADEAEVRALATKLYERVEWDWMLGPKGTICHGWKPGSGRLRWHWEGYDEALILYILALGSPTHPIPESSYAAWCSTYAWRTIEGLAYLHAGPLFIHQMSHIWVDFRGIQDAPMRAHGSDYFINSRLGTRAQQRYAMRNPRGHAMYGEFCWGITASDGPGTARWRPGSRATFYDYVARGIPDFSHYVTSKGAVTAFTRCMSRELGAHGICVNTLAPGYTLSDTGLTNTVHVEQSKAAAVARRALKRDQYPEDLVGSLIYLCSSDSDFMTGQLLAVDGGSNNT